MTQDEVKRFLVYNQTTGIFTRNIDMRRWKAGTVAGGENGIGYIVVSCNKKKFFAHRLAWFYMYGYWPDQIDHINGVRGDNRICNLRAVSNKQNSENRVSPKWKKTPIGVSFDDRKKKWRARITHNKKEYWLGYFDDIDQASAAYKKAASKLFTHSKFSNNGTGF